jgi:hypothetical protein
VKLFLFYFNKKKKIKKGWVSEAYKTIKKKKKKTDPPTQWSTRVYTGGRP